MSPPAVKAVTTPSSQRMSRTMTMVESMGVPFVNYGIVERRAGNGCALQHTLRRARAGRVFTRQRVVRRAAEQAGPSQIRRRRAGVEREPHRVLRSSDARTE